MYHASAKVPKVGSVCKGIVALALQIQDYCPSYKGLQGLLRPCEDCKDSTYLVMILYSTTSNHLAMQGNYIYFLLLHRPCEGCKDSTYLVMILYSTTSNHLAMQGNYVKVQGP